MEQPLPLLQRREGAVLVLSNNNPAARNALSPAFYAALTEALAQMMRPLDILLHDHVIVGGDGVFSFAREGLLPPLE